MSARVPGGLLAVPRVNFRAPFGKGHLGVPGCTRFRRIAGPQFAPTLTFNVLHRIREKWLAPAGPKQPVAALSPIHKIDPKRSSPQSDLLS